MNEGSPKKRIPNLSHLERMRKDSQHNRTYQALHRAITENGLEEIDSDVLQRAFDQERIDENHLALLSLELLKKREEEIRNFGIDVVTGFFGRPLMEKKINSLLKELNYKGEGKREPPLSLIMILAVDVDYLKKWNDDFGHKYGDQALRTLADRIRAVTRDQDSSFRLGDKSDEIITVMRIERDLSDEELRLVFDKVQRKINTGFVEVNGEKRPVTAAVGYTVIRPGEAVSVDDILHQADEMERKAKDLGVKKARIEKAKQALGIEEPH